MKSTDGTRADREARDRPGITAIRPDAPAATTRPMHIGAIPLPAREPREARR